MQGHVRQKMNNIVVDWLFQLHRLVKSSFPVRAIKICKLVTREGPAANVFQRITVEFCNRETFPPRTICNLRYSYVAKYTYLSEQFSKTFVTLQIIGKLHSCIKVHVNSFINYVINMITMHLLF